MRFVIRPRVKDPSDIERANGTQPRTVYDLYFEFSPSNAAHLVEAESRQQAIDIAGRLRDGIELAFIEEEQIPWGTKDA